MADVLQSLGCAYGNSNVQSCLIFRVLDMREMNYGYEGVRVCHFLTIYNWYAYPYHHQPCWHAMKLAYAAEAFAISPMFILQN